MPLSVGSRVAPLVRRERLISALDLAVERPLTLVAAPAGFGKTTAVRQFVEQADLRVAWITAEPGSDRVASWHKLASALHEAGIDPGSTIRLGGSPPTGDSEQEMLLAVIDDMERIVEPTLVVLDNLDVIHDPAILQHLTFLVNRLPPLMRLLVISRAQLALPIGRWRAQGRLAEIERGDLRFRPDEAAALLEGLGLADLSPAEVVTLNQRAEGWPVGLALLAASSREGRPDEPLDEDRACRLVDDLLGGFPSEIQEFVLSTSVLGRLGDDVAQAVTGRDDAGRLLQAVESANLFVVPADDAGVWFRYECLFGELMRCELERRDAGRPRPLHQRAARWYQEHGMWDDALHHLVAAGQLDEALALVTTHVSVDIDRTGVYWSSTFRNEWLEADPARMLDFAIAHGRRGRLDESRRWLDRAAADLAELPDDDPRQAVAQAVRALWYGVQFDAETTIELGSAALQRLAAQGGHDLLQRQLLIAVGNSHILREDLTAAERAMDDLAGLSPIATVNDLVVVALRARIALRRGELRQAETLGAVASQAAQDVTVGSESALRSGHYALGNVLAERGQLGEGERFLQRSVDHGLNQGWLAPAAMAELALADLRAARSGPAAGLQAVDEARHLMRSLPPNCELTVSADLTEARLRIAAGSYDQAERLLEQAAPRMDRSLTLVRLAVGRGDASRAADLLGAVPATTLRDRIMVHVLAARIAAISGDAHERDAQLLAAARLAEPEGYRLLWLTEAPGLLPRLRELVEWDTSLGPYATSVADLAAELPQNVAGAPLSEREVMVLRYLRRDATTREIAAQLDVSVNTLKTHLQSIYRKLGVTSRSGAVAAGSQSGLI